MDAHLFKKTKRNSSFSRLHTQSRPGVKWVFLSGVKSKNSRAGHAGFFEVELLIWLSVIFLILTGFMGIHKAYKKEHGQIREDFKNEWNKLESKRRN